MCYILETRPARRYLKMTFCSECIISNTYTPLDKKKRNRQNQRNHRNCQDWSSQNRSLLSMILQGFKINSNNEWSKFLEISWNMQQLQQVFFNKFSRQKEGLELKQIFYYYLCLFVLSFISFWSETISILIDDKVSNKFVFWTSFKVQHANIWHLKLLRPPSRGNTVIERSGGSEPCI